jgi:RNA polymerase sigma-70 factor (ECF subfamily)
MSNQEAPLPTHTALGSQSVAQPCTTAIEDIESLVLACYPYIRRLAYSILDDLHEADDAAQETFIAASRASESFRGQSSPKTWLASIAVNICRGRLRKRRIRQKLQSVLEGLHLITGHEPGPEKAALQNEADLSVWQAVDALDEKHRLTVVLRYVHDMTTYEIAAVLGTSEGTVYSRLHYARQRLKVLLDSSTSHAEVSDGTP